MEVRKYSQLERQLIEKAKRKHGARRLGVCLLVLGVFFVMGVIYVVHTSFKVVVKPVTVMTKLNIRHDRRCVEIAEKYSTCEKHALYPTSYDSESKSVKCEFNVATDLSYLPDPELYDCLLENPPIEWALDAERFLGNIQDLQNPSDCNMPKSESIIEPSWEMGVDKNGEDRRVKARRGEARTDKSKPKWQLLTFLNHGWGYNLFVFAWNAQNHWANNVPVIVGNSAYRFSDNKCGRGYSCELSPLSSTCSIDKIRKDRILAFGIGEEPRGVMSLEQMCGPHGKYLDDYGRCDCDEGFLPAADSKYFGCKPYSAFNFSIHRKRIHKEEYEKHKMESLTGNSIWFANNAPGEQNPHNTYNPVHFLRSPLRQKHGFMWEHAISLYYLLRSSVRKGELEAQRNRLGLNKGRVLGLHVRHGDSCHDKFQNHRICPPLSFYMERVLILEKKYGKYDKIFLATDDPQVISDTANFTDHTFVYQSQDREFYETGDSQGVDVRVEFDDPEKVHEIASDIWLLAHCHAFVASFASSVAWVAYEFMIALHGHYVPYVSIDLPYGHKKNVGRFLDDPNF
mmetsp:Transcript_37099/g.60461  ORF Transcript_37099/g.60461 Transcript_37099/m.60461 type:complete len:568 (+) Transcript_37099:354-2057(+)